MHTLAARALTGDDLYVFLGNAGNAGNELHQSSVGLALDGWSGELDANRLRAQIAELVLARPGNDVDSDECPLRPFRKSRVLPVDYDGFPCEPPRRFRKEILSC